MGVPPDGVTATTVQVVGGGTGQRLASLQLTHTVWRRAGPCYRPAAGSAIVLDSGGGSRAHFAGGAAQPAARCQRESERPVQAALDELHLLRVSAHAQRVPARAAWRPRGVAPAVHMRAPLLRPSAEGHP